MCIQHNQKNCWSYLTCFRFQGIWEQFYMSKANINLKTKNISFEKMWSLNVENTVMGKKKTWKGEKFIIALRENVFIMARICAMRVQRSTCQDGRVYGHKLLVSLFHSFVQLNKSLVTAAWAWPPAELLFSLCMLQKSASIMTSDFTEDFARHKRGRNSRGRNFFSSERTEWKEKK